MVESGIRTVTVLEARLRWSQITEAVLQGERYVVTFHGRPRCAIVPVADLEQLQRSSVPAKPTKKARRVPRE